MGQPRVFISYQHNTKKFAREVVQRIKPISDVIIDNKLAHGASLSGFMESITKYDLVLLLVSDKYLHSINCLYEVSRLLKKDSLFEKKTMFIVLEGAESVYSDIKYSEALLEYWYADDRIAQGNSANAIENNKKIKEIRYIIDTFLFKIKDKFNKGKKEFLNDVEDRIKTL